MKVAEIRELVAKLECERGAKLSALALYHLPQLLEIAKAHAIRKSVKLNTLDAWHESEGDVLWWRFPVDEPPYVGSPLDTEWPGYHTHWQRIEVPEEPTGGHHSTA